MVKSEWPYSRIDEQCNNGLIRKITVSQVCLSEGCSATEVYFGSFWYPFTFEDESIPIDGTPIM